jgi:hypothetical protein
VLALNSNDSGLLQSYAMFDYLTTNLDIFELESQFSCFTEHLQLHQILEPFFSWDQRQESEEIQKFLFELLITGNIKKLKDFKTKKGKREG